MFNTVYRRSGPILDHNEIEAISDKYRKSVTSVLLENQEILERRKRISN